MWWTNTEEEMATFRTLMEAVDDTLQRNTNWLHALQGEVRSNAESASHAHDASAPGGRDSFKALTTRKGFDGLEVYKNAHWSDRRITITQWSE